MVKVIGKGVSAIKDFIAKCQAAGGSPTFVPVYKGVPFKNKVIARCYLAADKVPGGVIEDVPEDVMKLIIETRGRAELEELLKR